MAAAAAGPRRQGCTVTPRPDPKVFLQLAGGHNDGFIFMRAAWVGVLAEFLNKHMVR